MIDITFQFGWDRCEVVFILLKELIIKKITVAWWTPLCGKKVGKRAIARACVDERWAKEATLPVVINCIIISFSHMMSCHAKLRLPTAHSIPKAFVNVSKANLMFAGVVVDPNEEHEN